MEAVDPAWLSQGVKSPKHLMLDISTAQNSLAKVRTLIIRADVDETPAYGLFVDRSLAQYVWGVVYDAGRNRNSPD